MTYSPPPRHEMAPVVVTPFSDLSIGTSIAAIGAAVSGSSTAGVAILVPLYLPEPFTVLKAFWANGSTAGTNSIDIGVYRMTNMTTGRVDLIRSTGAILSAGTLIAQGSAAWRIATTGVSSLTSGSSSVDATSYTTASVTLKAGRLYLMSVENSKASADVVSVISSGPTFTSRSSTQFNGTANRISIWSAVPTVDYTGTLVIDFGGGNTQTGACWSLDEFSGVDTSTTNGIVQNAVGTGNSTTPLATLGAFGNANNATFGATGQSAANATAPGTGFTETADVTAATPAQALETEWRVDNSTAVGSTITSNPWGICAVELKADASSFIIPASSAGASNIYMAMCASGTTAQVCRLGLDTRNARASGMLQSAVGVVNFPLPSTFVPVGCTSNGNVWWAGFSLRALLD